MESKEKMGREKSKFLDWSRKKEKKKKKEEHLFLWIQEEGVRQTIDGQVYRVPFVTPNKLTLIITSLYFHFLSTTFFLSFFLSSHFSIRVSLYLIV